MMFLPTFFVTDPALSGSGFAFSGGMRLADRLEAALKGQAIKAFQAQAGKNLGAAFQFDVGGAATAAGSSTPQWAVMGWPGNTGQVSAAASQTVNTKSSAGASWPMNSSQLLLRSPSVR